MSAGLVTTGVVAAAVLVLGAVGVYHGSSGNWIAAVLGLVGVILTASVPFLGQVIARQSERRLRLDAAMRAGALLRETDGRAPTSAAVASGLLALTELNRADLAVALLVGVWDRTELREGAPLRNESALGLESVSDRSPSSRETSIPDETAVLVIDAALRSRSANAQLVAAELLCRNSDRLDIRQSLHWPSAIDGRWNPAFNNKTKLLLVDALIRMALTSDRDQFALQSLAVRLFGISDGDPDKHVKGCVGVLLNALLQELEQAGSLMQGPREVTYADLSRAAAHAKPNPNRQMARVVQERAEALNLWATRCEDPDYRPGALAAVGSR